VRDFPCHPVPNLCQRPGRQFAQFAQPTSAAIKFNWRGNRIPCNPAISASSSARTLASSRGSILWNAYEATTIRNHLTRSRGTHTTDVSIGPGRPKYDDACLGCVSVLVFCQVGQCRRFPARGGPLRVGAGLRRCSSERPVHGPYPPLTREWQVCFAQPPLG